MSRRGVALLLVLVVLVLAVGAASAAARLGVVGRAQHTLARRVSEIEAVTAACDGAIAHFLTVRAPRLVLPPDAPAPEVAVLDDLLLFNGAAARVVITAFDQCGMVPRDAFHPASPLRAAIRDHLAALWESRPRHPGPEGLDSLLPLARSSEIVVYPVPGARAYAPIGAVIATHNPVPGAASRGLINVNTAPPTLLAAALRAASHDGLEAILAARSRGEQAPVPGVSGPVQFSSQSNAWAFRLDITLSGVRRSWWCVWVSDGTNWRCAQRALIDE